MATETDRPLALVTRASSGIGPILTRQFPERAGLLDTKIGAGESHDPADVARDGFQVLMEARQCQGADAPQAGRAPLGIMRPRRHLRMTARP